MNRDEAAVLCRVTNHWLKLVAQHTDTPPGEAVRAALTALYREAPEAAAKCKALMAFTQVRLRVTPTVTGDVTQDVTQFGASPSHHAELDMTELITVEEAANMLGVQPQAVRAAARRGSLPAVKDDTGQWQINLRDVEKRAWTHQKPSSRSPVTL